jgi:hypothetical protein
MKRDMDLIRAILFRLEEDIVFHSKIYEFSFENKKLKVEGYSDEEVYSHLVMLLESPFIEGRRFMSGEIEVKKLTWNGREFLDSVRGDEVWKKTKAAVEKIGGTGMAFIWEIAKGVIKSEMKTRLGIDVS